MARVGAGALIAWFVPERWWLPMARALGRAAVRLAPREASSSPDYGTGTPSFPGWTPEAVAAERIATGHAARLYGLREYRPGSRRPAIELRGAAHLQRSLDLGNGAILWVARFAFAPLFFKIALHEAGFAVSHLSRPTHGFGKSPFAVRWLNPIWTRIEERYVHERIVVQPGAEIAALRTLRKRLADNSVVSITVGDEAVRTVKVPFLGGSLRIATGPVTLAATGGTALLPVFGIRRTDGAFVIEIQPPFDTPAREDRQARITSVVNQYAGRLEPFVREYPSQWIP